MNSSNDKVISDFVSKFEMNLEHKRKVNFSEEEQIDAILEVYTNYIKYFSEVHIKHPTVIKGKHPYVILDFPEADVDKVMSLTEKSFMELGIRFKRHRFSGSLPIFSAKNNSVPGLLYGRGYFMLTFSRNFKRNGAHLKIECLRENQMVKVLDSKLNNLTLVYWNGTGMSRTTFNPGDDKNSKNQVSYPDDDGLVSIELISNRKGKNVKVRGDFSVTLNDEFILERITSIDRG